MARGQRLGLGGAGRRHDEIGEALKVNRPSTVWQGMHNEPGLQAILPSLGRYALTSLSDAYARYPHIAVRRDNPPPGEEAHVDYGRSVSGSMPRRAKGMI